MFAMAFMRSVPHRRSSFWHFDAIIPRYFWTDLQWIYSHSSFLERLDVNVIGFKIKWYIMLSDSYKLAIALKNDLLSPHKSLFHSHTIFEQYDFLWGLDIIIELLHINFTLSFVFFVMTLFAKIFNSFKYLILGGETKFSIKNVWQDFEYTYVNDKITCQKIHDLCCICLENILWKKNEKNCFLIYLLVSLFMLSFF